MIINPLTGETFDLKSPEQLVEAYRDMKHSIKQLDDYKKKVNHAMVQLLGKKDSMELGAYTLEKKEIKYYVYDNLKLKEVLDSDMYASCCKPQLNLISEVAKGLSLEDQKKISDAKCVLDRTTYRYIIK